MPTVFSHIVSKRFAQEYENITTDSLAFIIQNSQSARNGMMKLIRGVIPDMPELRFRTQQTTRQTKNIIRPDMAGFDDEGKLRVFIENKFWAGLTDNQPNSYLKQLAECGKHALLLVVVPEAREHIVWNDLNRKLREDSISVREKDMSSSGIVYSITTGIGPKLAVTSWRRLLLCLDDEVAEDPSARRDLFQLRALCDEAESNDFVPLSLAIVSDQLTPAFILQINSIVRTSIHKAVNDGVLNLSGTAPRAKWDRIGQYANISPGKAIGFYLGINFRLWKTYGRTPLWLVFSDSQWGRALQVMNLLEPWADKENIFTKLVDDEFVVAIDMPFGEEKDEVVRAVVERLKEITYILRDLTVQPLKTE
jgi:hypothetical protein